MATSQDVKEAADTCVAAKAALAAAEAEVTSKELEALAMITSEIATRNAADEAFNAAFDSAKSTVGWHAAEGARQDAQIAKDEAVAALVAATTGYDQS